MNSALYRCKVMHSRLRPRKHDFVYNIFMFWLDLDEIEKLSNNLFLFSNNSFNVYSFYDKDHVKYPENVGKKITTKQRILHFLKKSVVGFIPEKIFLLTHVRIFNHVFNPVSFYFCYDEKKDSRMVIAEVGNTFGEMKMFIVDNKVDGEFVRSENKYFYVSPFIDLDNQFHFHLKIPSHKLQLSINVSDEKGTFFYSTLSGDKKNLSSAQLIFYMFRFPVITLQVISAIHWQAFKLWFKRNPYHKKSANKHLQRDIVNPKK